MRTILVVLCLAISVTSTWAVEPDPNLSGAYWARQMVYSVMEDWPGAYYYGSWDYVSGTVLRGIEDYFDRTGDPDAWTYLKQSVDWGLDEDGDIYGYDKSDYSLDQIKKGSACLRLLQQTSDERYGLVADLLRGQLAAQPRVTAGGFWHKLKYPYQMWLDGLYMAEPFYAHYNVLYEQWSDFNDVVKQFVLMELYARDEATGLLYHGWDEQHGQSWADPYTGCSASFWGRAMGWYAMGLVDTLDYLPASHPGRETLIAILQRLVTAMVQVQDESGVWWQVVDQGGREGNYLESSVSCMMTYAMAKGVRLGYLDPSLSEVARRAFDGVLREFVYPYGNDRLSLSDICRSAGLSSDRDGSYEYYVYGTYTVWDDGKGVGPFIGAALEVALLEAGVALQVDDVNGPRVELSWQATECQGYRLERGLNHNYQRLAVVDANTTTYMDVNAMALTTYQYRIKPLTGQSPELYTDIVTVTTQGPQGEPLPVSYPVPVNESIVTEKFVDLSWQPGLDAVSHNIYFGPNDPPEFWANQTDAKIHIDPIERGVTYYWRVDQVNDRGVTQGPVWQFTTYARPPR